MTFNYKRNSGVALIQVLLISAVLSLLAIQLNKSAKINTHLTQGFNDKTSALIHLKTVETQLLYEMLLANDRKVDKTGANFFGQPFHFDDSTVVSIQDTSGLHNVHFPSKAIIERWLSSIGQDEARADYIVRRLKDFQDSDNEVFGGGKEQDYYQVVEEQIQNIELSTEKHLSALLKGVGYTEAQVEELVSISTAHSFTASNPYHAPNKLIDMMYDANISQQIKELRDSGSYTRQSFINLTGIDEGEGISFSTSPYLDINITVSYGSAKMRKRLVVELIPFFKEEQGALSFLFVKLS
ncbi:type II secretion system protein GspK [Thalassotalea euphylliae]|uniref:type II secretion system protein GspK n=1 Tax=Thalassotalea euphylliae TaxID=1655234 RepID=UPI0015F286C5|nr:type II secretion system protein GspK [Thalassotalea euphylliae]